MKRREIEAFAEALADEIPAVVRALGVPPDTCVLQTRLAVEVARAAGLQARPFPVRLTATPPEGTEFEGKPYCRRLGFGSDDTIRRLGLERFVEIRREEYDDDDRWDGHVGALVARRYFVDPSIGQLNSKVPKVPVQPMVLVVGREFVRAERPAVADFPNGSRIVYEATPENKGFIDDDWRREPGVAELVLQRVRARL